MTTVAAIVPFYQARAGILARAVRSILAQALPPGVILRVIVVDDGSPSPAAADLSLLSADEAARVELIVQPNGGPAAARNRGIDAAQADFIAFLDSDDEWRADHLAFALAALGEDADLYFSDVEEGGGATWFQRSDFGRSRIARRQDPTGEVLRLSGPEAKSVILAEHPTHASSVVYRYGPLAAVRFRPALRSAGEDHIFWIELAAAARAVAVGGEARAGRHDDGVSMFAGSLDWDDPKLPPILISILSKYRILEREPALAGPDLPLIRERRRRSQDQIAFILMRSALKRPGGLAQAFSRLAQADAAAPAWFAPALASALAARATGRFEIVF